MGFSGLQCAHLLDGRGKARLAYDPDNLALLCVVEGKYPNGCHRWLDDHPLDMHKVLVDYMGEEKLEEMHQKSLESGRRTPEEKWEILDELNKMRKQL